MKLKSTDYQETVPWQQNPKFDHARDTSVLEVDFAVIYYTLSMYLFFPFPYVCIHFLFVVCFS